MLFACGTTRLGRHAAEEDIHVLRQAEVVQFATGRVGLGQLLFPLRCWLLRLADGRTGDGVTSDLSEV